MIDVIRVSQILSRFSALEQDALADAMPVIAVACAECTDRLKDPGDAEEPAVLEAVAAICNYRLLLRSELLREGTTVFKAGDVSATLNPTIMLEQARALRDDAYLAAACFFKDTDFLFEQM